MEDMSLIDLYEDLSVDKFVDSVKGDKIELFTEDLAIDTIDEQYVGNVEEDKIDLYTEALAIDTSEKVQYQLLELKKENERLRQENEELKENRKQLSKNISSLFLTARREILKKDQEIAKLMNGKRDNYEPVKVIADTVAANNKAQKVLSKQPPDSHVSFVSISTVKPKEEKHQSEIRGRLMQEINQSYSLSSCQGVAFRNLHKRNSVAITSEKQHTSCEELKLQHISTKGGKAAESKQSIHNITHTSNIPDHKDHHVSTVEKLASKGGKQLARKNKVHLSDVETPKNVKIRKIEAVHNGEIKQILTKENEMVDSMKHDNIKMSNCGEQDGGISVCDSDTVCFNFEQSALINGNLTVGEQLEAANKLKKLLKSEKEIGNSLGSVNINLPGNIFDFKTSQEQTCEVSNPLKTSKFQSHLSRSKCCNRLTNIKSNDQVFHISQPHQTLFAVSTGFADTEASSCKKFDGNGSSYSNYNKKKDEINLSETKYNSVSNNSADKTVVSTKISSDSVRHVNSSSQLKGRKVGSEVTNGDKQTLHSEGHSENQLEPHETFSEMLKNFMSECNKSYEIDKNTNCNKSEQFPSEKSCNKNELSDARTDLQLKSNAVSHVNSLQQATSFITCTSNLILLGDEEASCTTFVSPSKLQPSEFYPPGVRGDVHEGGSHVRHIRGLTEVIPKFPSDLKHSILKEHGSKEDKKVQAKTLSDVNVSNTPVSSCFTDCHTILFQSQKLLEAESLFKKECSSKVPKAKLNPVTCAYLEVLQENTKHKEECSDVRVNSSDTQFKCKNTQDWASTVNEMFGQIFQKKLKPN